MVAAMTAALAHVALNRQAEDASCVSQDRMQDEFYAMWDMAFSDRESYGHGPNVARCGMKFLRIEGVNHIGVIDIQYPRVLDTLHEEMKQRSRTAKERSKKARPSPYNRGVDWNLFLAAAAMHCMRAALTAKAWLE